jgi:hypothetical protein
VLALTNIAPPLGEAFPVIVQARIVEVEPCSTDTAPPCFAKLFVKVHDVKLVVEPSEITAPSRQFVNVVFRTAAFAPAWQ